MPLKPYILNMSTTDDSADRREAFCQAYITSGGVIGRSAISAGFPPASASVRGTELLRRRDIQLRIKELLLLKIASDGVKAQVTIADLARRSTPKDAVRLRAAQELCRIASMFGKVEAAAAATSLEGSRLELLEELRQSIIDFWKPDGVTRDTGIIFSPGVEPRSVHAKVTDPRRVERHLDNHLHSIFQSIAMERTWSTKHRPAAAAPEPAANEGAGSTFQIEPRPQAVDAAELHPAATEPLPADADENPEGF